MKIFDYYGLTRRLSPTPAKLTYGNNVKEVTSQVSEAAADCGIIYATDACSAGLTVADSATAEMCGQVIYPAAVLKGDKEDAARAFLAYLQHRCRHDRIRVRRFQPRDLIGLQFVPPAQQRPSGKRSTPNRSEERRPHMILRSVRQVRQFGGQGAAPLAFLGEFKGGHSYAKNGPL